MNSTSWETITTQERPRLQPWTLPDINWKWYIGSYELATLVEGFAPISLEEMDAAALLDRTDTKFMMPAGQLLRTLASLQQDYWMLSIHGQRFNHYRTLYFDTPDFELYHMHVNGRADLYKVRSREYTDSCLSFLEVKHKTCKGRTIKDRIPTPWPMIQMTQEAKNWLNGVFPYDNQVLEPKIWNTFTRFTLVGQQYNERVTLDLNLTFYTANKVVHLDDIAIAEVKMDIENRASPFLVQMRAHRIHPRGFSKYCIGVSMLYDQVKKNAMKPKLLWIEKMTRGAASHE